MRSGNALMWMFQPRKSPKRRTKYHAHGGIRSDDWTARSDRDGIFGRRIPLQNGENDGGRDGPLCPWEREPPVNRTAPRAAFAGVGPFCCSGRGTLSGSGSLLSLCKSGAYAFAMGILLAD